jgi:uncharacterized protein (DUF1015 family)
VADLVPFRGVRYTDGPDLSTVAAPPYDVVDAREHAELLARDANNAVRLILPDGAQGDPYECAALTLAAWLGDGVLAVDASPALYAYRMITPGTGARAGTTVGVIGALTLPDGPDQGEILPHERTLPKAKSDRLALLRATRANFDPIWGLTLSRGLTELVAEVETVAFAVDDGGVRHELGVITAAEPLEAIRSLVRSAPVVLADGHHRFETACTYHQEVGDAGAGKILALVVELDDAQLDVRPFHRVVTGDVGDLRPRLAHDRMLRVQPRGAATPDGLAALLSELETAGALGLVDHAGLALLAIDDAGPGAATCDALPPTLRDVDAARFDVLVRPTLDGATLAYRSDAAAVAAEVREGSADAAILLRPVTVSQIRAAAAAGVRMPEKTTYFAPKPRTGLVMRVLDDD